VICPCLLQSKQVTLRQLASVWPGSLQWAQNFNVPALLPAPRPLTGSAFVPTVGPLPRLSLSCCRLLFGGRDLSGLLALAGEALLSRLFFFFSFLLKLSGSAPSTCIRRTSWIRSLQVFGSSLVVFRATSRYTSSRSFNINASTL
jgi:hypothetical protein